jgi:hypothetical protein
VVELKSCEILCCVTGKLAPNTLGQYDSADLTIIHSGDIWHQIPNNQGQSEKCGHPRQVNNLVALKPIFFKRYGLGHGWQIFLRACVKIVDNFWRNYFTCGNLRIVAPYFQLFQ